MSSSSSRSRIPVLVRRNGFRRVSPSPSQLGRRNALRGVAERIRVAELCRAIEARSDGYVPRPSVISGSRRAVTAPDPDAVTNASMVTDTALITPEPTNTSVDAVAPEKVMGPLFVPIPAEPSVERPSERDIFEGVPNFQHIRFQHTKPEERRIHGSGRRGPVQNTVFVDMDPEKRNISVNAGSGHVFLSVNNRGSSHDYILKKSSYQATNCHHCGRCSGCGKPKTRRPRSSFGWLSCFFRKQKKTDMMHKNDCVQLLKASRH